MYFCDAVRILPADRGSETAEDGLASQRFKGFAQLRLENDHESRHRDVGDALQDPEDRIQVKYRRKKGKCKDHQNSLQKGPGPGVLDPQKDLIDNYGDNNDLHKIREGKRREKRRPAFEIVYDV